MQWWLSFIRVFVKLCSIRLFRPASGLSSLVISRGTHVSAITLRTLRHFLMSFTAPSNASSSGTPMMRLHPQPRFASSMSCCCWVTPARSSSHSWRIFATSALSSAFLVRIVRISSRMSCRLSSTSPLPRPRPLLMPPPVVIVRLSVWVQVSLITASVIWAVAIRTAFMSPDDIFSISSEDSWWRLSPCPPENRPFFSPPVSTGSSIWKLLTWPWHDSTKNGRTASLHVIRCNNTPPLLTKDIRVRDLPNHRL